MTTRKSDLLDAMHKVATPAPPLPPKPRVPWSERVASYHRARPALEQIVKDAEGGGWERDRMLAHYLGILEGTTHAGAHHSAKDHARQALANLGYVAPREREAGEDDEPESAWNEPLEGDAGDITKRPPAAEGLALGIPEDPLEAEFTRPAP